MTRNARFLFGLLCLGVTTVALLSAQQSNTDGNPSIPHLIHFSGALKDVDGNPARGTVGVTFAFYKEEEGGAPLWMETQNVTLDASGRYPVMLGATKSDGLPAELFISKEARWLGVEPKGLPAPVRVLLLSVPYALKAADAETIGGLPPSAFVLAAPTPGTSSSNARSTSNIPPTASNVTTSGGTVNLIPLWSTPTDIENSAISQTGSGASAKIGIGTTTPVSTLDVKGSATIRGKFSLPATGVATSTGGKSSQPANLAASSFNSSNSTAVTQTFEFKAEPTGNNTATPSGTLNLLFGTGTSAPAETGLSIAHNGQITFATGQTFPGTGSGTITGVTAGTALTGGGTTGNVTLNLDTSKVPLLNAANTFTGNQTVNGNVSATGVVTGSSFQIGSNLFAFGTYHIQNAFLGFAGNSTMTGGDNTATGPDALASNTSGSFNDASGWGALFANTTGVQNTATEAAALQANTTGGENTATGGGALAVNTTGFEDTATGAAALGFNKTGSYNTASGFNALEISATGDSNTADGAFALWTNTTGAGNTAIGSFAGNTADNSNLTASNNTFVGWDTAISTGTLTNATAIGANAKQPRAMPGAGQHQWREWATADTLVGIGTTTPAAKLDVHGTGNFTGLITFASGQTFPGTGTITGVTAGTDLTGGGSSGNVTLNVDTTRVVTGVLAGTDLTGGGTGGVQTLNLDTTKVPQLAAANTFTGNQTVNGNLSAAGIVTGSAFQIGSSLFGFGNTGASNAFLGFAGNPAIGGERNTGVGVSALFANTTGSNNTATGAFALGSDNTGSDNTASGLQALYFNTTGFQNSADGEFSLIGNTTGSYNTASGNRALLNNTTGNFNTGLGYQAGPGYKHPDLTNATAIGDLAEVDANNSMVLGSINGFNGATNDTNVGIGITAPAARLHIGSANVIGLRVEGPTTAGTGAYSGSFGGYGDFNVDSVGTSGGRFTVKENGLVGINTSVPDSALSVNGSADKTGGGSWVLLGSTSQGSRRPFRFRSEPDPKNQSRSLPL